MQARIGQISTAAFTIPTDRPEGDGTLAWNSTAIVLVFITAGGQTGLGYSYASPADAALIGGKFPEILKGRDAFDIPGCWHAMRHAVRNLGLPGQVASAIAAVDTALWDLKAKLLGIPLAALFGSVRHGVPVYGSGGFTTYSKQEIQSQIESWKLQGITRAKIKIGSNPEEDIDRVRWAREALAENDNLFVDANGAYRPKQALAFARAFREHGVAWFEEPVPSDDLEGLSLMRREGPPGMDIAAGEYGYDIFYFRRMIEADAVDVLQIDVTRAQGYSGFIHAASVAMAANIPVSAHCAPALHLPVCCHIPDLLHQEYFHDHARIERMLFDGVPPVKNGCLVPDRSAPGHGLIFKQADAERYAA